MRGLVVSDERKDEKMKRLIEVPRRGKAPGRLISNFGATLGNWNDRRSSHDRRAEASLLYRAIDRVAGWLYTYPERRRSSRV